VGRIDRTVPFYRHVTRTLARRTAPAPKRPQCAYAKQVGDESDEGRRVSRRSRGRMIMAERYGQNRRRGTNGARRKGSARFRWRRMAQLLKARMRGLPTCYCPKGPKAFRRLAPKPKSAPSASVGSEGRSLPHRSSATAGSSKPAERANSRHVFLQQHGLRDGAPRSAPCSGKDPSPSFEEIADAVESEEG